MKTKACNSLLNFGKGNTYSASKLPVSQYSDELNAHIMLLNEDFVIQKKKLEDAYEYGIISEREYDQWLEFFDRARREWLAIGFTKPENIFFLYDGKAHLFELKHKQ